MLKNISFIDISSKPVNKTSINDRLEMPRFRTVRDVTDRGTRHDREKRQAVFKLKNDLNHG
jgi:hypothetical protein